MNLPVQIRVPAAVAALVAMIVLVRCTKELGKPVVAAPPPPGKCDTVTYEKHIRVIMTNSCVSCHNDAVQSGNQNLKTYDLVKGTGANGKLANVIFEGVPSIMPYGTAGLSATEKEQIRCWLDNGMKQ